MEELTWELGLGEQEGLEGKELKALEGPRVEEAEAGRRPRSHSRQKSRGCGMAPLPPLLFLLPSLMPQAWRPL